MSRLSPNPGGFDTVAASARQIGDFKNPSLLSLYIYFIFFSLLFVLTWIPPRNTFFFFFLQGAGCILGGTNSQTLFLGLLRDFELGICEEKEISGRAHEEMLQKTPNRPKNPIENIKFLAR